MANSRPSSLERLHPAHYDRAARRTDAEGTPLARMPALDPLEMARAIATARILMPASRVRLAAGRKQLSPEAVTLCFLAGANSIFVGEKLLTTPNPGRDEDEQLLESLGMKPLEPHAV